MAAGLDQAAAGGVGCTGKRATGVGTGVGVGAVSGVGAEGREDIMDTTLAMLTHLMERMDAADARQVAMGEELRAFYAAMPTGSARAVVAEQACAH